MRRKILRMSGRWSATPILFVLALAIGGSAAALADQTSTPPPDPTGPPSAVGQPSVTSLDVTSTLSDAETFLQNNVVTNPSMPTPGALDVGATRVLATLPASAEALSGLSIYTTPTSRDGACVTGLNAVSCGTAPDAATPAKGLGLMYPGSPLVFVGTEASSVLKHSITCDGTSQDVTSNAGDHVFVYVSSSADTQSQDCSQTFTLQSGEVVTTPV